MKNNKIDYNAFITGDRNSYAVINERIFDLKIGKMILTAPQKDASLRSMQIDIPLLTIEETKNYVENILKKNKEVINFYSCEGCI